jgi:hypothetical protein
MQGDTYKQAGVVLSVVAILVGLGMIGATFTSIGPSFRVGIAFGGLLVVYGALRLYWFLKR